MTAPALGPASSLASPAVDMAPATGVLGCPSCDCIRLRALLTPASSGALVARVRAGRDGQSAGRPGGRAAIPARTGNARCVYAVRHGESGVLRPCLPLTAGSTLREPGEATSLGRPK